MNSFLQKRTKETKDQKGVVKLNSFVPFVLFCKIY